jgi:hypothetical protein
MDQYFSFSTEMLDQLFVDGSCHCMALLQIPVARQGQMEVDVKSITRAPGAKMVQVDPFGTTKLLQGFDNTIQDCFVGFVHQMAHGLTQ